MKWRYPWCASLGVFVTALLAVALVPPVVASAAAAPAALAEAEAAEAEAEAATATDEAGEEVTTSGPGTVAIRSGTRWTDTNGDPIQAHGGGMLRIGETYYWYGEYRDPVLQKGTAVALYSSTDLVTWTSHGQVFGRFSDPTLADSNLERPKIAYHPGTGKFVLWVHKELAANYSEARAVVAVSDAVEGPYTYVRQYRPMGNMSRDCTLFVDDDGTAYFISAANENADLIFYRLTDDWLDVAEQYNVFPGQWREAPAVFKRNGVYYIISSGTTGWAPNRNIWSSATNLLGPYSAPKTLTADTGTRTFGTQSTYVQPVQGTRGTTYLFMADKWQPDALHDSRYLWLPLAFEPNGDITPVAFGSHWRINARTGMATYPQPVTTASENIALGAGVTTDVNNTPSGNAAAMAVDGDPVTRWAPQDGNAGHWLTVDLGAVRQLARSELTWNRADRAQRYRIDVSSDGVEWTTAVERSTNDTMSATNADDVAVAARYVRITGLGMGPSSSAGYYWMSINQWRLLDTDGVDVALRRPVDFDSQEGSSGAEVLTDGRLGRGWAAGNAAAGHYAVVDLGADHKLTGARLVWPEPTWFHEYTVEVSSDGVEWRTVTERTGEVVEHAAVLRFTRTSGRFVRITVTGYEANGVVGLQEIELFGTRPLPRPEAYSSMMTYSPSMPD